MNSVNSNTSNFVDVVQKAVTRNTATQVIEAKQSGSPIDIEEIKQSNQQIKDDSVQIGLAAYQANIKKNTIDTYVQATQNSKNSNDTDTNTDKNEQDIYTFDAQAVNDARSTVHKRAIGISVYEQIQSTKEP